MRPIEMKTLTISAYVCANVHDHLGTLAPVACPQISLFTWVSLCLRSPLNYTYRPRGLREHLYPRPASLAPSAWTSWLQSCAQLVSFMVAFFWALLAINSTSCCLMFNSFLPPWPARFNISSLICNCSAFPLNSLLEMKFFSCSP